MNDDGNNANPGKRKKVKIEVDDTTALGAYANFGVVNHTDTEFVMDFIFVQPMDDRAKVRSRIISSPRHAKRFLMALQDNVRRYEARFGEIQLPIGPPMNDPSVN